MALIDDLDDVVSELADRYPRFRRVTIERLVARTARRLSGEPREALLSEIRREAEEQLCYADEAPGGLLVVAPASRTAGAH
jgi:hypothetical protein